MIALLIVPFVRKENIVEVVPALVTCVQLERFWLMMLLMLRSMTDPLTVASVLRDITRTRRHPLAPSAHQENTSVIMREITIYMLNLLLAKRVVPGLFLRR